MRFNHYMANHFSSCTLIARARDLHRNRDVTLHAIPGEWEVVGVSDGVDAWVAPALPGLFEGTATGNVHDILRRMKIGEEPPPIASKRPRVRLDDPTEPARTRVRLDGQERKRVHI